MASNVVPLVAAFGLFLAAPALVAHLAATPAAVGLEATDVDTNLDEIAPGGPPPSSVYVQADAPDVGQAGVSKVTLFRADVLLGTTPTVEVTVHQPGQQPAKARLGGFLTVTPLAGGGWDVLVRPSLQTAPELATFNARFQPAGPTLSASLRPPAGGPVELQCAFGGAACTTAAAGQGVSPTLQVEGNLGAKELDSLTLTVSGVNAAYLSVERVDGVGYAVNVAGHKVPVGGTIFTYDGDLASDDVVVFRFMDADGSELAVLTVDRAAGTTHLRPGADAPIAFQNVDTMGGVVAVEGDPTAPSRLTVLSTSEMPDALGAPAMAPVLTYTAAESGAGGTLNIAGLAEEDVPGIEIVGSPLDPWGFSILAGGQVIEVASALAGLPLSGAEPVITILKSNAPEASFLVGVEDAMGTMRSRDDLIAGDYWLTAKPDHTVHVAIPESADTFTRITVRQAPNAPPTLGAPAYPLNVVDDSDPHLYQGYYPPVGRHGDAANLMIRYETAVSPLVVQTLVETGYSFFLDAKAPVTTISAPKDATGSSFEVRWTGTDEGSGLATFSAEWSEDGKVWKSWVSGTTETARTFSGDAGKSYSFRVFATDNAGNVGEPSATVTTNVPANAPENRAPTVEFLKVPAAGAAPVTGKVTITWKATDPDGRAPTVNLYSSRDDGATWTNLYSGGASRYDWDTTRLQTGAWRLKIEATDGSKSATDVTDPFQVKGIAAKTAGTLSQPGTTSGSGGADDATGGEDDTPGDGSIDDPTGSDELGTEGDGVNGGATKGARSALVWVGGILAFVAVAGLGIAWYMRR